MTNQYKHKWEKWPFSTSASQYNKLTSTSASWNNDNMVQAQVRTTTNWYIQAQVSTTTNLYKHKLEQQPSSTSARGNND